MRETIKSLITYYEAIWDQSKITNDGQTVAIIHILSMEVKRMIIFSELERGLKLLRVLGALLEDSSSFPSTHVAWLTNACDIGSSRPNALFRPRTEIHTHK